jgi:hypothetical protein
MGKITEMKGSIQDIPAQTVMLFRLGTTLLVTYLIYDNLMRFSFFSNALPMKKAGAALQALDYGMVFLMIGMFTTSFFLASKVRNSKLFIPLSFMFLIISVWISSIFSNIWSVMVKGSVLGSVANSLPFASRILLNLPLLMFASGSIIIVALYTRVGGGRRAAR